MLDISFHDYLPREDKAHKEGKQSNSFETKRVERIDLPLQFLNGSCSDGLLGRPAVEKGWDEKVFEFRRVGQCDEVEQWDDNGDKERKVDEIHQSQTTPALEK